MHFIIREDYWRPLRAASYYFFFKKSEQTDTQTHTQTHKLPPASSDVGAPGPILCSCGRTVNVDDMPLFHCSSSQFFNIHRHNAICDATIDLLNSVASSHTAPPSSPSSPRSLSSLLPPMTPVSPRSGTRPPPTTPPFGPPPRQSVQDFTGIYPPRTNWYPPPYQLVSPPLPLTSTNCTNSGTEGVKRKYPHPLIISTRCTNIV